MKEERSRIESTIDQQKSIDSGDLLYSTATHEAGHVVMRWHLGLNATKVEAGYGFGFCYGSNEKVGPENRLLLLMAGYAAELGDFLKIKDTLERFYPSAEILSPSADGDFAQALRIVHECPYLRSQIIEGSDGEAAVILISEHECIERFYEKAVNIMWEFEGYVEALALELCEKKTMNEKEVAHWFSMFDTSNETDLTDVAQQEASLDCGDE